MNLKYMSMPDHFVKLLTSNSMSVVEDQLRKDPMLKSLTLHSFKEYSSDENIQRVINVVGWMNIRNKLSVLFIDFKSEGKYPEQIDIEKISQIIEMENSFRHFSYGLSSRIFLFGFYLKLINLELSSNDVFEISELMKLSVGKSERIDWLLLLLWQLLQFFGFDRLKNLLNEKTTFDAILFMLSKDEKSILVKNFLNYGSSIRDEDFFLTKIAGG